MQLPEEKNRGASGLKKPSRPPKGTTRFGAVSKEATKPAATPQVEEKVFGNKAIGPTFKMLRPEVKTTLDKVMY